MSLYVARLTMSLARRALSLARKIEKYIHIFVGAFVSVSRFMSSLCKGVTKAVTSVTGSKIVDSFLLIVDRPHSERKGTTALY